MRKTAGTLALVATLAAVTAQPHAADGDGDFAVKGVGFETCERYLSAKDSGGNGYVMFRSWLNGFVTAYNARSDDLYDASPIYNIDVLSQAVANICASQPETRFTGAALGLMQQIADDGLKRKSPSVAMEANGQTVRLPREILRRAQARLQALGHYSGGVDGVYGPGTRSAFERFQNANDLAASGLPDTLTLVRLFADGS